MIVWRVEVLSNDDHPERTIAEVSRAAVQLSNCEVFVAPIAGEALPWSFSTFDDDPVTIRTERVEIEGAWRPHRDRTTHDQTYATMVLEPVEIVADGGPFVRIGADPAKRSAHKGDYADYQDGLGRAAFLREVEHALARKRGVPPPECWPRHITGHFDPRDDFSPL